MHINVLIGPIGDGFNGVQAVVYKDFLPPHLRRPNDAERRMLDKIERHLNEEFYQKPIQNVAACVRWRIDHVDAGGVGEGGYATTSIVLAVNDERYREFGRKVFSRCHSLFPYVSPDHKVRKPLDTKSGLRGWFQQNRQTSVGWDEESAARWGQELQRRERARKRSHPKSISQR